MDYKNKTQVYDKLKELALSLQSDITLRTEISLLARNYQVEGYCPAFWEMSDNIMESKRQEMNRLLKLLYDMGKRDLNG